MHCAVTLTNHDVTINPSVRYYSIWVPSELYYSVFSDVFSASFQLFNDKCPFIQLAGG